MDTEQQVIEKTDVAQTDDAPQYDPAVVKRAEDMGWVAPDKWRGDPPKGGFKSPEEFITRGEEVLPIVKSQLRSAEERATKLESELAQERKERGETFTRLEKMSRVALDGQRKKLEQEFEQSMDSAAEVGDVAKVRELRKESREALADFDKTAAVDEPAKKDDKDEKATLPKAMVDTIKGWVDERPWFTSDKEMHSSANAEHERLLKTKPGLSLAENLEAVDAYVRKRFPEKFGTDDAAGDDEPPRRGSRVEGGTRINGGGAGSLYTKLPADAKKQADKFIKEDGLFLEKGETVEKNMTQARERYARDYFGEEA